MYIFIYHNYLKCLIFIYLKWPTFTQIIIIYDFWVYFELSENIPIYENSSITFVFIFYFFNIYYYLLFIYYLLYNIYFSLYFFVFDVWIYLFFAFSKNNSFSITELLLLIFHLQVYKFWEIMADFYETEKISGLSLIAAKSK